MNPFAIDWGSSMNKPEKLRLRGAPDNVEIVHQGDTIVMRRIVDSVKFRKIAAKVLANMPKPMKGESIVRELNESRHRGGK